jgi:hypothetical protein
MAEKQPYDYIEADRLHEFVRKWPYKNNLKNSAMQIYFSLAELEKAKTGLCRPTTATYREIAKYAFISLPTTANNIMSLDGVLCEIKKGTSIMTEKQATRFRRYTIEELREQTAHKQLRDERPLNALKLTEMLKDRKFIYGNEIIKPLWSISKTGRLQAKKCKTCDAVIQNVSEKIRIENLITGLKPGEVLYSLDYKSAEPTIIQHAVNYQFDIEPYSILQQALNIDRAKAKQTFNSWHYFNSDPLKTIKQWGADTENTLRPYAERLKALKDRLFTQGKPKGKQRRTVTTATGAVIQADRGKSPHRGKILSWYAQATVADILNKVCLQVIEQEKKQGWRFLYPVHDSAYIIGLLEHEKVLKAIFEAIPGKYKIPMQVKVEKWPYAV